MPIIRPTDEHRTTNSIAISNFNRRKKTCQKMRKNQGRLGSDPNKIYKNKRVMTKAVLNGCYDEMKKLIDDGADIDLLNRNGRTALMAAAYINDVTAARILIDNGADVSLTDNQGHTAYDIAANRSSNKVLKVLKSMEEATIPDGNGYYKSLRQDIPNIFFNGQETSSTDTETPNVGSSKHYLLLSMASTVMAATTKIINSVTEDTSERHEGQIVNQIANSTSGFDTDFSKNIWWIAGAVTVSALAIVAIGTGDYFMRPHRDWVRNHNNTPGIELRLINNPSGISHNSN